MNEEDIKQGILESSEILRRTKIAIPEFQFLGSKSLEEKCVPVERNEFGQPEIERMARKMIDVLKKCQKMNKIGRGLAANQIGLKKEMIVAWLGEGEPEVIINPKVLDLRGKGSSWECCLSSATLIGQVIRPWEGTFEYRDVDGGKHMLKKANPGQTRLMLHEIDHLKGKLCVEKYEPGTMRYSLGVEDIKSASKLERIE